jgi:hypothetical protein
MSNFNGLGYIRPVRRRCSLYPKTQTKPNQTIKMNKQVLGTEGSEGLLIKSGINACTKEITW